MPGRHAAQGEYVVLAAARALDKGGVGGGQQGDVGQFDGLSVRVLHPSAQDEAVGGHRGLGRKKACSRQGQQAEQG